VQKITWTNYAIVNTARNGKLTVGVPRSNKVSPDCSATSQQVTKIACFAVQSVNHRQYALKMTCIFNTQICTIFRIVDMLRT